MTYSQDRKTTLVETQQADFTNAVWKTFTLNICMNTLAHFELIKNYGLAEQCDVFAQHLKYILIFNPFNV